MKSKPKAQRIYSFFEGANVLTVSQIDDIEQIIDTEVAAIKAFLNQQKLKASESN